MCAPEAVIPALDVDTIYQVPIAYHAGRHGPRSAAPFRAAVRRLSPICRAGSTSSNAVHAPEGEVRIAVVGKYTNLLDSYKSLAEALAHGGIANRVKVRLDWVDSEIFEQPDTVQRLEDVHGILVPGGFGERGTPGKIEAVRFARERNVPFFGICFGMQMAVIEAARNLAGLRDASSTEFGPCDTPVVGLLTEWARGNQIERRSEDDDKGGTMRLGAYPAVLGEGSLVRAIYGGAPRDRGAPPPSLRGQRQLPGAAWRRRACVFPACRRTACCRRSSNCRAIPGSSACSIIRN